MATKEATVAASERSAEASHGDAPERVRRRPHVFPRTVLGLSVLLFFMGIAAAFSGAVLYAYYESRQEQTVTKVDNFVGGFSDQLDAAKKVVQGEGDTAKQEIRNQLDELQKFAASGST